MQPNVCVLLAVGTMPGPNSIYHLSKAFDIHSNVGGSCVEIVAPKGTYGQYHINPLVTAQDFECKMSDILDKPLESVFGHITVLPGAFNAYRHIALQNEQMGEGSFLIFRFIGSTTYMLVRLFAGERGLSRARIRYTIHGYLYEYAVLVNIVKLMCYCVFEEQKDI